MYIPLGTSVQYGDDVYADSHSSLSLPNNMESRCTVH